MAINVRRPKQAPRAKLTSLQAGASPGMESQQPGRTPGNATGGVSATSQTGQARLSRPGVIAARPTNTITPNRGGLNPRGTLASLRKKLFRSY